MNVENIKRVRDHIAALPDERFNMLSYVGVRDEAGGVCDLYVDGATNASALEGSCGTCACIAGWTLAIFAPDEPKSDNEIADAGKILDLTFAQARRLFEPNNHAPEFGRLLSGVTRSEAVAVLDRLMATGNVDWSIIEDAA